MQKCSISGFSSIFLTLILQEEPPKLAIIGRDSQGMQVVATEFLIDSQQLFLIAADAESNAHMFSYSPFRI